MLLLCACCSFGLIREPFHFYSYSCTHMHCYLRRKLHERKNWLPEAKVSANFLSSSPANKRTGSGLASRNFHPSFVYSCVRASNLFHNIHMHIAIQERLHAANIFSDSVCQFLFFLPPTEWARCSCSWSSPWVACRQQEVDIRELAPRHPHCAMCAF